ncbi:MAG: 5-amino-6-(D-ribitylamino)uracil--L-tyrosine 4-hydroxyphenyl transferase CofH [Methanobacteriaceae archaeon]
MFNVDPKTKKILENALDEPITKEDALYLMKTKGSEAYAIINTADNIRKEIVGDNVTFINNWNINFTNVCSGTCNFCAFKVKEDDENAYLLDTLDILRTAKNAYIKGAGELCIQGGLHPSSDYSNIYFYEDIVKNIKSEIPQIHLHSFSPMEIYYGSKNAELSIEEGLKILKKAGLDTMPGTAAEILNNDVRKVICPSKITSEEWIDVIKTAHNLGIKTTATMMYGHVETLEDRVNHLETIRNIQKETGGFTEFVPLTFMYENAPIYKNKECGPGATGLQDLKIYAISRLMFQELIPNIQSSWVKLGFKLSQLCLLAGANDIGGTLGQENISKTAGAHFGTKTDEKFLKDIIVDLGRIPAKRNTDYSEIEIVE